MGGGGRVLTSVNTGNPRGEGGPCPRACRVLLATGVLTVPGREVGRLGSHGPGLLILWVRALQGSQQLQRGCPHAAVTLSGPLQEVRAGGCGVPARPFRVTRLQHAAFVTSASAGA